MQGKSMSGIEEETGKVKERKGSGCFLDVATTVHGQFILTLQVLRLPFARSSA